jgi:hypothetical protein
MCKCGYSSNKRIHVIEHIMLLEPHRLHKSRLLPFITDEKVKQSEIDFFNWQKEHTLM